MEHKDFRQRVSAFETGEVLWRAFPDRLEQYAPDGRLIRNIPFDRVRRLRVAWAPSRMQPGRLLLELSGQTSRVTLSNMHFAGIGNFEDRSESFYPFLWLIAAGVRTANPQAIFRAGERPELYWPLLAFSFGALGLLAAVLLALPTAGQNAGPTALIKGGLILVSLPLLFGWAWKSRPRGFDPDHDLDELVAIRGER